MPLIYDFPVVNRGRILTVTVSPNAIGGYQYEISQPGVKLFEVSRSGWTQLHAHYKGQSAARLLLIAYWAGWEMNRYHIPLTDNPHSTTNKWDNALHRQWESGWLDANLCIDEVAESSLTSESFEFDVKGTVGVII